MSNREVEEPGEREMYGAGAHEGRRWGMVVIIAILVVGGAFLAVLVGFPLLQSKGLRFLKYKEAASGFVTDKEFGKAIRMYQKALALKPTELDVRKSIAQCRLWGGDLPEAIAEYHRCLRMKPDDAQVELTLASLYLLAKNVDRSKEILDEILQSDPDNVLALTMYAQCHYERSDTSHPMVTVSMITDILPTTSSRYDLLTPSEIVTADTDYENKLLEAVKATPKEVQPHKNLADFYRRQKRLAEAEQEYQKMVEVAPQDPDVRLHLADFYMADEVGRLQDAIKQYSEILDNINPKNLFALRGIAGLSLGTGDLASATRYVERVLWEQSSDPFARYFRAVIDLFNKQLGSAEEGFRFVAKENPTYAPAHFLLGYVFLLGGQMDETKKSLEEAAKVDLTFARPRLLLAEIALTLGETDKALDIIGKLLLDDRQKDNPLAYVMRGRIFISQNDYTQAEAPFAKLAELDQQSIYPKLLLGGVYKRTDKKDQAVKQYELAIKADPSSALASYLLGLFYERTGERVQSRVYYEKAVEKDPNFAVAARSLAEIYVKSLREDDDPKREISRTLENSFPNNSSLHFALLDAVGQVFYQDRQFDKAIGIYELIPPEERDGRPHVVYRYAMALYGGGRNAEARRELKKAARWMRNLPKDDDLQEILDDITKAGGISG